MAGMMSGSSGVFKDGHDLVPSNDVNVMHVRNCRNGINSQGHSKVFNIVTRERSPKIGDMIPAIDNIASQSDILRPMQQLMLGAQSAETASLRNM